MRSRPDGYTLLRCAVSQRDQRDALREAQFQFHPRHHAGRGHCRACPYVMEVNPSVPAKTVPEFIAYAKSQSGKSHHGVSRHRDAGPCRWRAVQDDDRCQHGSRAVSRRWPGADRSARRTGTGRFRSLAGVDRVHQGRQAARAGGDHRSAFGGAAGHSARGRVRARLRGEPLEWGWRAEEYAR